MRPREGGCLAQGPLEQETGLKLDRFLGWASGQGLHCCQQVPASDPGISTHLPCCWALPEPVLPWGCGGGGGGEEADMEPASSIQGKLAKQATAGRWKSGELVKAAGQIFELNLKLKGSEPGTE